MTLIQETTEGERLARVEATVEALVRDVSDLPRNDANVFPLGSRHTPWHISAHDDRPDSLFDNPASETVEGENTMNRTEASFAVRRDDRVLAWLVQADCVVLR